MCMMINVNELKRNAKNIVKKYSGAQTKVREATSNDPWGPSSTIMSEIADLTYNVVALSEIMHMLWKRIDDHNKNWRHVYKALVVLEYLIKTGSEKVTQQCMDNIFAIQTLKDFQYLEDNKDHGRGIREKSKKLVNLLGDPETLRTERAKAMKAKSRFVEAVSSSVTNVISDGSRMSCSSNYQSESCLLVRGKKTHSSGASSLPKSNSNLDTARPLSSNEEERQLQVAIELSKQEAEQREQAIRNDELKLRLALNESKKLQDRNIHGEISSQPIESSIIKPSHSTIDDLLGLEVSPLEKPCDPWSQLYQPTPDSSSDAPHTSNTFLEVANNCTSSSNLEPINSSTSYIWNMSKSKDPFEN